jgi:SAM-dependent methyltransferase
MRKIRDLAGRSVLDVGCRDGGYVRYCHELGRRAAGVDVALQRTRGVNLPLVQASAGALPFASDSFDTVLVFDVLEHTPDDAAAVRECARIARGNILLTVPRPNDSAVFNPWNGLTFRHYVDSQHRRYYEPERIQALAARLGYSARGIEPWCPIHPNDVYIGGGAPRLLCRLLDRLMWTLSRNSSALLRNLFAEVLVTTGDQ